MGLPASHRCVAGALGRRVATSAILACPVAGIYEKGRSWLAVCARQWHTVAWPAVRCAGGDDWRQERRQRTSSLASGSTHAFEHPVANHGAARACRATNRETGCNQGNERRADQPHYIQRLTFRLYSNQDLPNFSSSIISSTLMKTLSMSIIKTIMIAYGVNEPINIAIPLIISTNPRYIGFLLIWNTPLVIKVVDSSNGFTVVLHFLKALSPTRLSPKPTITGMIPSKFQG